MGIEARVYSPVDNTAISAKETGNDRRASPLTKVGIASEHHQRSSSEVLDARTRVGLSKSRVDGLDSKSANGEYKLTLRDKFERFWRNNASQLIMGAITGAGLGVAIGGISGLMATGGVFSVPMAILGGIVGAPIGAFLFVTVPRFCFKAEVDRYDIGGFSPAETHLDRNKYLAQAESALSDGVNNAFKGTSKSNGDAGSWKKQISSWVENSSNFSFWNLNGPKQGGGKISEYQHAIVQGFSKVMPFLNRQGREAGYARISDYKHYIAEVLNTEKDAFLDVGRIVPAPIKTIPPGILSGFSHIEYLAINESCSVDTLPGHMLEGLSKLKDLSISDNRYDDERYSGSPYTALKTLPANFFDSTPALEALALKNNDLRGLPDGIFKNLTKLKSLDISGNEKLPLTKELAQGLTNLEELNLSGMHLTALPKDFLANLPNLKVLDISYNDLAQLPDDAFEGLDKLEQLNIEGNGIESLPPSLLKNLPNLKALRVNLEKDPIKQLPDGFAKVLLGLPGCFPEFNAQYADRLEPSELARYVEAGSDAERVDRLKLLYTPGVVEGQRRSLNLSGLSNLTALPSILGGKQFDTLDLSGNESLEYLPDDLQVQKLVLKNCGPKKAGASLGSLEKMAMLAKEKLSKPPVLGIEDRSLLDSDGIITVYGSIDMAQFDRRAGIPDHLVKSMDWDKYNPSSQLIENLHVNGSVSVANRSRLTIPNGVVIRGDLSLKSTNVEEYPDDLQVMGKIYIDKAYREKLSGNLQELPEHLRGKVEVRG